MHPLVLAKIAVRIVALYLIAYGIMQLTTLLSAMQFASSGSESSGTYLAIAIATIISPAFFGVVMWFLSNPLAKRIIGNAELPQQGSLDSFSIQATALATVGLILVVLGIPDLIITVNQFAYSLEVNEGANAMTRNALVHLLASFAQLALGIMLIFGASGGARLLHKIRGMGLHDEQDAKR